jgi:hypothetical protein
VLLASGVRGVETGAAPTLVVREGTREVRLRLELRENEYQSYQIVLQAAGGREVFKGRVKPQTDRRGASFTVTLPASRVSAGDYVLTLRGSAPGGELEDVSQSLFRVEKR